MKADNPASAVLKLTKQANTYIKPQLNYNHAHHKVPKVGTVISLCRRPNSCAGGQNLREAWELEIIGRYYLVFIKHKPKFTYGTQGPSLDSFPYKDEILICWPPFTLFCSVWMNTTSFGLACFSPYDICMLYDRYVYISIYYIKYICKEHLF